MASLASLSPTLEPDNGNKQRPMELVADESGKEVDSTPKTAETTTLPRKVTQDAVHVTIPLNQTVDLGVALRRTREKRRKSLLEAFPQLERKADEGKQVKDDGKGESTLDDEVEEKEKKQKKKKPVLKHVPQQYEYSNMVDYLEAKYARGVMLDDDADEGAATDGGVAGPNSDDEGAGSVYSQTSFLDDTDLQRTVAGQVMAHNTTTKLELADDQNDFFVNVGELEVEETEMTKDNYDPLKDVDEKENKKRKRTKKTLPKTDSAASTTSAKSKTTKKAKSASDADSTKSTKKKPSKTAKSPSGKKPDATKTATVDLGQAEKTATEKKQAMVKLVEGLEESIKSFDEVILPRRKTTEKVTVTCPEDKNGGDSIVFPNPHSQNQKLKVTVPAAIKPGGKFMVTVPVARDPSDDKDYNKFGREFHDLLDDYARAYDEWCDALGSVHSAKGTKYNATTEKRSKFDQIVPMFPTDTKTAIDKVYLQKVLRRGRQNRYKREQNAKKQKEAFGAPTKSSASSESRDVEEQTMLQPELATEFSSKAFNPDDFPMLGAPAK